MMIIMIDKIYIYIHDHDDDNDYDDYNNGYSVDNDDNKIIKVMIIYIRKV